jgi:glutathione S-transferase
MPDIVLHHLEASRSHRVLWLLEELELPYRLERHARHPKTMRAPKALRDVHPLGKSPVLTVDGVVYAESGAILEEVVETWGGGRLRPDPGTAEHRRYRYWLHYAEGSLMPPLLVKLVLSRLRDAPAPFFVRPILRMAVRKVNEVFTDPELQAHGDWIERALTEQPWFAGEEITAADVQMSYPVEALLARSRAPGPQTVAWMEKIRARPAYQRALAKGGEPMPG